jgi:hypothetical protein
MNVVVKVVVGCMELSRLRLLPRPPIFVYWNHTRDCRKHIFFSSVSIMSFQIINLLSLMTLFKLEYIFFYVN